MLKLPLFPLAVALALTGCSAFQRSQTWRSVVDHRADRVAAATDKSNYAEQLHAVLAAENVEHKIVKYQFRYQTRLREEAVGAGAAVIYRDPATPGNPWWIMDETTAFPVWAPDRSLERQLSFFLGRPAEVLAQNEFPAGNVAPPIAAAPTKVAPWNRFSAWVQTWRSKRGDGVEFASRASDASIRPAVEPPPATSKDSRFDAIFRTVHGTNFDPRSRADRQKMSELQALAVETGTVTRG